MKKVSISFIASLFFVASSFICSAQSKNFYSCSVSEMGNSEIKRVYFNFEDLQIGKERIRLSRIDKINFFDAENCTLIFLHQSGSFTVTLRKNVIISASLLNGNKYYELLVAYKK